MRGNWRDILHVGPMKHRYSGKNHIGNKIHHLFPDRKRKETHPSPQKLKVEGNSVVNYAAKSLQSCPTLCIIDCQALLSMEFSRQEYWSGLPFPSPGDLPNPWIEHQSPALQADSLPLRHQEGPVCTI